MSILRHAIYSAIINHLIHLNIMFLYIFISYLVTLGMILESYTSKNIPLEAYFVWALSPITCPIIVGMEITKKN
jgi:hypothetical protein